jgi:hypothetical protein
MTDRHTRLIGAAALAVFITVLLLPADGEAIPAFARKYRMSCTTCHAPVPRLKAFGDDFAGNAFMLAEDQEPKRFFYDTGDEILTLMRELPVAVRFDAFVQYDYEDEQDMADLKVPFGIKLLSGGNISKHIGYYFYFYMSEQGEVAGIEDAYIHFNDLLGQDLDLMVGQFQVSDPIFKRELRLTYEDYEIYRTRVGDAPTNLTYDRGVMVLYGAPFGLDAVFEFVNGNGKGTPVNDHFDSDDWKNVLLRLSQSVGPVRIGGFGYLCNTVAEVYGETVENEHYYWGVDGTADYLDRLQLNVQYIERRDDNPFFMLGSNTTAVDTRGGFAELIWAVNGEMGRTFLTALYNYVESKTDTPYETVLYEYNAGTLSLSYLLRRNLRLVAEGTYNDTDEAFRFVGGFVSAF